MKLISLAVLSFLAITVSAYPGSDTPPQSTTTQSAEQPQSTTGQSEQQYQDAASQSERQQHKQELQAGLEILRQQYKEERNLIEKIKAFIQKTEDDQLILEQSINRLDNNIPERDEMIAMLNSQALDIDAAHASLQIALQKMEEILENHSITEGKLKLLNEAQQ
ncbi:hypothetical protein BASA82_001064 [Batrachochytrium salamandrivorans]|uniref:Uncharacterized protein n=1 Tax=Batrachochytrium salamandrivorans TaxID=1357716 RepID=A0ABQ8EZY5_9FUNG|nr:hypothetical protein BASA62_009506 [Batrachochytrium salamandrivorans]KAH6565716.1 hypothetical protein BASA60_009835 [Batrachochytrium salamandrivorans]KAH6588031.1 hypothetical protein BASA50_010894 [Batrachochytrium salamandrivorans]KAH6591471.1 hypothetical protein BASA61_004982 [Batrachochytrium salamandrivorans]KAH9261304.1 hypothetical protein BASA82_001064 [Batrachochytrium salamandrivorans]